MARPLRIEYKEAWYHVLNRGRRKEKIFFSEEDLKYFLDLLGKCTTLFGLEVHAYSLMPNHYHLLIRTPNGNLSRIMRHINGVYTQRINKKYKYEGSLFKGRFKAILIEEESYLLELVRYIHQNPLKARIEKHLGEHRWTSHRAYMRKKERPLWLVVKAVLEKFGKHEGEALKELDLFVKKMPPRELEEKLDGMKWPVVFGGEAFKEMVKKTLLGKKINFNDVPESKEYSCQKITTEEIVEMVSIAVGVEKGELQKKRNPKYINLKRAIIYVCRVKLQFTAQEIGEALGGVTRAVIMRQCDKACREKEKKEGCFKEIRKMERIVELRRIQVKT